MQVASRVGNTGDTYAPQYAVDARGSMLTEPQIYQIFQRALREVGQKAHIRILTGG